MKNSEPFQILLPIILIIISASTLGIVSGMNVGRESATRETVKICVERPQECKTMYDFHKIGESKK